MEEKRNFKRAILGAVFFPFVIFIFAPVDNYLVSAAAYNFSVVDIFIRFFPLFVLISCVLFLILYFLRGKKRAIGYSFVFSLTMAMYIQGNFLNNNYGLLDGKTIEWDNYSDRAIVSTATFIIVPLFVLAIVVLLRKKDFEKLLLTVSGIVMSMLAVTCCVQIFANNGNSLHPEKDLVMTKDGIFDMSSSDNTVVFIVDTLDTDFVNDLMEEKSFEERMEDFTFYNNCVPVSSYTYINVPYILTGILYKNDKSLHNYAEEAYLNSPLLNALDKNNYEVGIYSPCDYTNMHKDSIPNCNVVNAATEYKGISASWTRFMRTYGSVVAFRYMPHYLKSKFVVYTDDVNKLVLDENTAYTMDDVKFYDLLTRNELSISTEKPVFKFYHLVGAHPPYTMTANNERVESCSREEQIQGCFNIIFEYIDQLKALGIYDNTNIMIMGDHGSYGSRLSAALLVKRQDEHKAYTVDDTPVSFMDDLTNTLLSFAGVHDVGTTFFNPGNIENRTAWVPIQSGAPAKIFTYGLYEVKVTGKSTDEHGILFTGNTYPETGFAEVYRWGEILDRDFFDNTKVLRGVTLRKDDPNIWFYGKSVALGFELEEIPSQNIEFVINVCEFTQFPASCELYINGEYIGRQRYDIDTGTLRFIIPKEAISNHALAILLLMDGVDEMTSMPSDGVFPFSFSSIVMNLTSEEYEAPGTDEMQTMSLGYSKISNAVQDGSSLRMDEGADANTWYINLPKGLYVVTAEGEGLDGIGMQPAYTKDGTTVYPEEIYSEQDASVYRKIFRLNEDVKLLTVMLWSQAGDATIAHLEISNSLLLDYSETSQITYAGTSMEFSEGSSANSQYLSLPAGTYMVTAQGENVDCLEMQVAFVDENDHTVYPETLYSEGDGEKYQQVFTLEKDTSSLTVMMWCNRENVQLDALSIRGYHFEEELQEAG